jgi:flagellar hook protein FlgE
MRIDNNLNAMVSSQLQVNEMASNLAEVANIVGEPEIQEVTTDLIDSIVGQIPEVISYSANAKSIETQNATSDMLLNIKA